MKKVFYYSTLALTFFASCAKEIEHVTVDEHKGETVTILANVNDTKTTHANRIFSWEEGEQISVGTSEGAYVTFDVDDRDAGTFKHTFDGPAPSLLIAVSPKQSGVTFTSASNYQVTLPATYSNYVPGTTNALMVGAPDGVTLNKFNFAHTCALLKISYANVPIGTTAFVLESDANITGTVSLSGTGIDDIAIANDNEGLTGNSVTLNLKSAVTATNSTVSFCIPVPTGDYNSLTIYLKTSDGKINATQKSLNKKLTLARGDVFTFPDVTLPAATVLTENFSAPNASNDQYSCSSSIGTTANREDFNYSWSTGTGTVFKNGIKLGNGSGTGSIDCSDILSGISTGKVFTVKVYAASYNTDGSSIKVSYNGTNTTLTPNNAAITNTSNNYSASDFEKATSFTFEKAADKNTLTLASVTKRLFVDKIEVIYGIVGGKIPVADPVFSEPEGRVDYGTTVTLSCGTAGATIHYTTDGTNPSSSSPAYSSAFTITGDITIKAIAVKSGDTDYEDSHIVSRTYTVGVVDTPVISVTNNVITISCETEGASIRYTTDGTTPTETSAEYSTPIAVGVLDDYTLNVKAFKDGYIASSMATRDIAYVVPITVNAPTFSPASGASVSETGKVTISTTTPGATIYYTTDGTDPTESSDHGTVGASTAEVTAAFEIKAIAIKSGNSSAVSTATYLLTASKTSFSSVSGNLSSDGKITFACAKNDGTSNPTTNSNQIRLYQPSSGKTDGGSITITAASGYEIASITLTQGGNNTSIAYKISGGSASTTETLSSNGTKTLNNLTASSVEFICRGSSSSERLHVKSLSVTYRKK